MPTLLNIKEINRKDQGRKLTCPRYNAINVIRRVNPGVTVPTIQETIREKEIKSTLLKKETQRKSNPKSLT